MAIDYLDRLRVLEQRLPFHREDVDQVNTLFYKWYTDRLDEDFETLVIWAYCRTQWYVLRKLARDSQATPNDFDQISSVVFMKVQAGMETVRDPERFVNWVNVVCRNAYVNERKKEKPREEINEEILQDSTVPSLLEMDRSEVLRVVECAIDRLPPSLSGVARMRLLEHREYQYISDATGLPLSSTRTYAAKAKARLCEDPEIQEIVREIIPGMLTQTLGFDGDSGEIDA